MPHVGPHNASRRRPTTYGKASRRAVYGLKHSSSFTGEHNGDQKDNVGIQETLTGHIRKTPPTMAAATVCRASPQSSIGSTEEFSTAKGKTMAQPASAAEYDLYDVPSSEEDRPPIRSKPVAKKRKVQEKVGKYQRERSIRDKLVRGEGQAFDDAGSLPPPQAQTSLVQRIGRPREVVQSTSGTNSQSSHDGSKRTGHRPMARTRVHSELAHGEPGRHVSATSITSSIGSVLESKDRNREYMHSEPPSSHESAKNGSKSRAAPHTPPTLTGKNVRANHNLTSHFSPSGLDIPGLAISRPHDPHTKEEMPRRSGQNNVVIEPSRTKLKDKLATREGVPRQDNVTSEDEYSTDEAEDNLSQRSPMVEIADQVIASDDASSATPSHLLDRSRKAPLTRSHRFTAAPGPKITYTTRQWTLRRESIGEDSILDMPLKEDGPISKPARQLDISAIPSMSQSTVYSSDSDNEQMQNTSVRTIHELRQAGGNARISVQAETILDDVNSNNVSLKRSGLFDLERSLEGPAFMTQFVNEGLTAKLLAHADPLMDSLTKCLLFVNILQIIAHENNPQIIKKLSTPPILACLYDLAQETSNIATIAKDRKSNVNKATQKDFATFCEKLKNSSMWRCGRPEQMTPRHISLQCLEYIVRHSREARSTDELLSAKIVDSLITILGVKPGIVGTVEDHRSKVDIKLSLSTLESYTLALGPPSQFAEKLCSKHSIDAFASLIASLYNWDAPDGRHAWSLALRMCLNLTNQNTGVCDLFARSGIMSAILPTICQNFNLLEVETSEEVRAKTVDNLVLSLAFLITIAEKGPQNRKLLLVKNPQDTDALDTLLQLFVAKWQHAFEAVSEEELQKNIPLGFLAVLLSYFSIDPDTRSHVASSLEGGNLKHLLIAVHEFLSIYRKAAEIRSSDDDADMTASFVDELQMVVDKLKHESIF